MCIRDRYGNMYVFDDDPTIGQSLKIYGEYCHPEIEIIKKFIDSNSFFIDIGANIGTHTIGLAPYVGTVLAFEPAPENVDLLKKN